MFKVSIFLGLLNLFELCFEPFAQWYRYIGIIMRRIPLFSEVKCILLLTVFILTLYYVYRLGTLFT